MRDHDQGPNTGGMGVISPSPFFTDGDEEIVMHKIIKPVIAEMKKRGMPFVGVLFAGLMKTSNGYKTLEFNVRFGDPETQALMTLIEDDIVPLFLACAEGVLHNTLIEMAPEKAIHVVMAAHGYPGTEGVAVRSGDEITLPIELKSKIFFAGVDRKDGHLLTAGGRVLGLTALANTYEEARAKAYSDVARIKFDGAQYRTDIGAQRG